MHCHVTCHHLKLLDFWCACVWWCSAVPMLTPPLSLFVDPCSFTTHYLGVSRGVRHDSAHLATSCTVRVLSSEGVGASACSRDLPCRALPAILRNVTRWQATFTYLDATGLMKYSQDPASESSDGTLGISVAGAAGHPPASSEADVPGGRGWHHW